MRTFSLLCILCMIVMCQTASGQEMPVQKTDTLNKKRLAIISGAAISSLGITYLYVKNAWWNEKSNGFHFDKGKDLKYALNLDKWAHFYGGAITADAFHDLLRWAGVEEKKSYLYGAGFGIFIQGVIEIKDGYAPSWGFSYWDVAFGSVGSFMPYAQKYIKPLVGVDFKMSYYKRTNRYRELNKNSYIIDDYINQTYWFTVNPSAYLSKEQKIWPKWLALGVGCSLDETIDSKGGGNIEQFISVDIDLSGLFVKKENKVLKKSMHYLNYLKYPTPSYQIAPERKFWPAYF